MNSIICLKGSAEARPIIQRVRDMGYAPIVIDANPNAVSRDLAERFICADHYDPLKVMDALRDADIRLGDGDGVLCCACDAPHVAAAVSEKYGLPGLSPAAAQLSVNKYMQKCTLRAAGIPVPRFEILDKPELPWWGTVVKPVDSRGGRGVVRALTHADFEYSRSFSPSRRVMVEQFLDGPQLSTESIIQDGEVLFTGIVTRNYRRAEEFSPNIIEDGCQTWIEHDGTLDRSALLSDIDTVITNACRVLGWYQAGGGTVKGDLVVHAGRVYVIELAARLSGGFLASYIIPATYVIPMVDLAIRFSIGERARRDAVMFPLRRSFTCQRYVFPEPKDVGKRVEIIHTLYIGDAEFYSWNIHPGDTIRSVRAHPDRWGQAICSGATPAEAQARAENAVRVMKASVVLGD